MSVLCYPICGNHPAIRIKRIRLPVNLADCIVPVGVPTQQIPPAPVLAHPASKILARHPAVRSLDPRIAVGKAFINWLHTLILGVALACVCTFWSCSDAARPYIDLAELSRHGALELLRENRLVGVADGPVEHRILEAACYGAELAAESTE